ncbi:MAG: hypothetical protein AB8G22_25080, partial [Saprospiraceae bacterium]
GELSEAANGDLDPPELVLKISADRPDLPIYDFLTFTLIARNEGGVAAEDIRINAPFIDYQTLTATGIESVTHGVFYNWTGNWDIERLEPGEEAILEIQTFVLSNQPTFRYFSVFEQFPADFDNGNNSILLNLPYTGVVTDGSESLQRTNADFSARPSAASVQLNFNNSTSGQTDIVLFELSGRLVNRMATPLFKGEQRVEMPVGNLPKGIYVVRRLDTGESRKVVF